MTINSIANLEFKPPLSFSKLWPPNFPTGHRSFFDLADQFAQRHIASVRYDKRTHHTQCKSQLEDQNFSPYHFISDAKNVIEFSKRQPRLESLPFFVLGHSQGVNFAVEVAVNHVQVDGVLLLAGLNRYSIDTTVLRQLRSVTANLETPVAKRQEFRDLYVKGKTYYERVRSGTVLPEESFLGKKSRFWSDWIEITDNAEEMTKALTVPGMIVQGEFDWNITRQDSDAIRKNLLHELSRAVFFDDLDHAFAKPGETLVPQKVGNKVSEWIKKILRT